MVVTGVVVVVDDVVELVEVVVLVVLVVVKSADAPDATRRVGPKTESIKRLSNRRILKNYSVTTVPSVREAPRAR